MTSGSRAFARLLLLWLAAWASNVAALSCRWEPVEQDPPRRFDQVQFLDRSHGVAHDGRCIWRTETRGRRWDSVFCADRPDDAPAGAAIDRIHFVDRLRGWMVTPHGALRATDDGGASWRAAGPDGYIVRQVRFLDAQRGWWVGEQLLDGLPQRRGVAFATRDGGSRWQELRIGLETRADWRLVDVWPRGNGELWLLGSTLLLASPDGGTTWRNRTFPALAGARAQSMRFFPAGVGTITVTPAESFFVGSAGRAWSVRRTPRATAALDGLVFADARHAWASQGGRLYRTADAGLHWQDDTPLRAPADPGAAAMTVDGLDYIESERTLVAALGGAGFAFCEPR